MAMVVHGYRNWRSCTYQVTGKLDSRSFALSGMKCSPVSGELDLVMPWLVDLRPMLQTRNARGAALLAAAFVLSGLAGWSVGKKPSATASRADPGLSKPDKSERLEGRKPATAEEFREWVEWLVAEGPGRKERMESWTDQELRSALDEGMKDPGLALHGPAMGTLLLILEEWTSRDPSAATEWWEAISSDVTRGHLAVALSSGWPKERASEGLDFVARHREAFLGPDGSKCGNIIGSVVAAALEKGPEAADEILVRLREAKLPLMLGPAGFPAGFDFAAFARAAEMSTLIAENRARFFYQAWLRQDPERAFASLIDDYRNVKGDPAESIFSGFYPGLRVGAPGMTENAGWLGKKIGTLDAEEQQELARKGGEIMCREPAAVEAFVGALTDPVAKAQASVAAARDVMIEDVATAMRLLAVERDQDARVDLLKASLEYRGQMAGKPFSAEDERVLRATLAEWAVAHEQIDGLVDIAKKKGGNR